MTGAPVPDAVSHEPIRAMKVAEVLGTPHRARVHPAGRYWRVAVDHQHTDTARCARRRHEAPAFSCTCGFHGVAGMGVLARTMCVHADMAVLDVDLSGRVVEHDLGWRASRQRVLGARFHDRCLHCDAPAAVIAAHGRWHPLCRSCGERARRRGRTVLTPADAASALGLEVRFAALPVETRRSWRHWRVLGTAALAVAVGCLAVLAGVLSAPGALLGFAALPVAASAAALARLWTARGSRPAPTLVSLQCWAVTCLATVITATALQR